MTTPDLRTSSIGSRLTDIIVLSVSFLLFATIVEYETIASMVIDLFFYVVVVFASLRVSKRIIFHYVNSSKRVLNILCGNIVGLIVGGFLIFIINYFVPGMKESMLVVVFSSIMAFFILGTLSPMVKSSHRDIIHH